MMVPGKRTLYICSTKCCSTKTIILNDHNNKLFIIFFIRSIMIYIFIISLRIFYTLSLSLSMFMIAGLYNTLT